MSIIAQQFGLPRGALGRLAGRFMERNNGDFNRWAGRQLPDHVDNPARVIELGPGPGIGLRELATVSPQRWSSGWTGRQRCVEESESKPGRDGRSSDRR